MEDMMSIYQSLKSEILAIVLDLIFPFQAICNFVMNIICDQGEKDNVLLLEHCLSPCYLGQVFI